MPTHFHFLIFVRSPEVAGIKNAFGLLQSSYTKAINKRYHRHGSLFQQHTKAKLIVRDDSLLRLVTYIHQNPVRAGFVTKLEDWQYSSYREYLGLEKFGVVSKSQVLENFSSTEDFREFSEETLASFEDQMEST